MLSTILYKKVIEKNNQNVKYYKLISLQKKYFLLCGDCFWMASTLPHPTEHPLVRYKKCPICKNKLDRFQIPNLYL
jgi:hypothetical protein